ncbi:TRAP transporter small permease [Pusillimonas sp. ANT_WB101]|uniref:TRAP transporter small permease n=1 Tax=Pusillimonas sp. ANT_WB101 TaxID=2597356 RepID=UPI00165E92B5|nr:TRAP transporter small permease [Pusillimonas sp. ANT_WB101]
MQILNRVLAAVEGLLVFVSGVCLILMMVLTTFDMLARKFLHFSIPSLFEFTEDYLMVGLVFLTLSYVYVRGGHIRVNLFERYIPPRVEAVWRRVHQVMSFVLFAIITVEGWDAAIEAYRFNILSSSLLAYPMAPALMLVPIGSAMLCLRILQSMFVASEDEGIDEASNLTDDSRPPAQHLDGE